MAILDAALIIIPPAIGLLWLKRRTGVQPGSLLIVQTLFFGAVAMALALLIGVATAPLMRRLTGVARELVSAFVVAGVVEETAKMATILLLIAIDRRRYARSPQTPSVDRRALPVWTGAVVGTGFAILESLLYIGRGPGVLLLRGVTALPMHLTTGVILGLALSPSRHRSSTLVAFTVAVVLHGVYDLIVRADPPVAYGVVALVAAMLIATSRLTLRSGMGNSTSELDP